MNFSLSSMPTPTSGMIDASHFLSFVLKQEFIPHVEGEPPEVIPGFDEPKGETLFNILLPGAGLDAHLLIRIPINPNVETGKPHSFLVKGCTLYFSVRSDKCSKAHAYGFVPPMWCHTVRNIIGNLVACAYHGYPEGKKVWAKYEKEGKGKP